MMEEKDKYHFKNPTSVVFAFSNGWRVNTGTADKHVYGTPYLSKYDWDMHVTFVRKTKPVFVAGWYRFGESQEKAATVVLIKTPEPLERLRRDWTYVSRVALTDLGF